MLAVRTFSRRLRRCSLPSTAFCSATPLHATSRFAHATNVCPLWEPSRRARAFSVTRAVAQPAATPPEPSGTTGPRTVKELPPLDEKDLEETFVKGRGPGGQKVNKTSSTVVIRHIPSGVTVRCQEHRSQVRNRATARQILQKKLDEIERGKASLAAQELSKARARKARRRRKAVKKHFKSRADRRLEDRARCDDY